ncbi:MAG: tetratricopeptide repeat protein [Candidatus Methylacidiphilales bacterium]
MPDSQISDSELIEQADLLIDSARYRDAAQLLRPRAEGSAVVALKLAQFVGYTDCREVTQDEAASLLRVWAMQNNPRACYQLAFMLDGPEAEEKNQRVTTPEGREWLEKAAQLGDIQAMDTLGVLNAWGDWIGGTDASQTRYWYGETIAHGEDFRKYDLGMMLLDGEGGPVDTRRGLELLTDVAHHDSCASRALADIYQNGRFSIPADKKEAARWRAISENS